MSRLEGFREASRALGDMKKAAAQGVGRRSLAVPANILAAEMKERAPVLTGALKSKIEVVKARAKKGSPRLAVLAGDVAAMQVEFGNHHQQADPFARPALEAKKAEMLDRFGDALREETDKSVIRAAKRAARKAQG